MATDELANKLNRRNLINEGEEEPGFRAVTVFNPYTEFPEFSRKEIQAYQKKFNEFDTGKDKFIDLQELKYMMEKLGCAQTHLGLKAMIAEVDEDHDDKISFREFLLIFRKASTGELANLTDASGLLEIYSQLSEIDVDKEGVGGAAKFFQAKIESQTKSNKFEQEIKDEQEQKRREAEEKREKKAQFKDKANFFEKAAGL